MDSENNSNVEIKINDYFKLPIHYIENKSINKNTINDLELIETKDNSMRSLYHYYFNLEDNNYFSNTISKQFSEKYTTNKTYLYDSQKLVKEYEFNNSYKNNICCHYNLINIWNEIKNDNGFKEKYQYIDWKFFEYLNHSEQFLQLMSIYNLIGPILTFITPIVILIIPFLVLKIKKLDINFNEYISVLKQIASDHAIGKLFTTNFKDIKPQECATLIISAGFYIFTMYQHALTFIRFNENMKIIHDYLITLNDYLTYSIDQIDNFTNFSNELETYQQFNTICRSKYNILLEIKNQLANISEYKLCNYKKIMEIGKVLKIFYQIYENTSYNDAIIYSFGFHGYIDCINGLQQNIIDNKINLCEFSKINCEIKNCYYGILKEESPVKNDINFKKNIIITGPNASGKTTIMKSTIINLICSQQLGCGFYERATIKLFNHIHCYLNIPDTSGRDSLFQAEARRCKDIINCVEQYPDESHFCIFDELFSGTNPEEAILSAQSFLSYLTKNKQINFLLSTHFVKLCKKLKSNKYINNYCMQIKKDTKNNIIYNYKFKKGISSVKGGINILNALNYPKEILNKCTKD